jgi:hypothetical protein
MDHQRLRRHHHDDHRREVNDESVEVEPGERADHDIGRIADQGCSAADIGREYFREQERIRRDVELLGDGERYWHDQEHRRHVVEQRGHDGGGELQQQQDAGGTGLGLLRRPYGQIFEHAGAARDRHQDHHAGKQPDGVPIDAFERLVLVQRADDDHHRRAEQRDDRPVELVPDDDGVGDAQDDGRDHHRIEAEENVRRELLASHLNAPQCERQARESAVRCQAWTRRTHSGASRRVLRLYGIREGMIEEDA